MYGQQRGCRGESAAQNATVARVLLPLLVSRKIATPSVSGNQLKTALAGLISPVWVAPRIALGTLILINHGPGAQRYDCLTNIQ
jgi:hypothetical protein